MSRRFFFGLFVCGLVAVIVLSLLPAEAMPALEVSDKIEHAAAYAFLAFTGALALRRPHRWLVAGLAVLGIALEIAQTLVPGRSFDLVDGLANAAGAILGVLLAHLLPTFRQGRRVNPPGTCAPPS